MNYMKTIFNFLLAGILFTSCGCSKENISEQLPPATQTGANTFGCKVNGVVYSCKGAWEPKNFLAVQGVHAHVNNSNEYSYISALCQKPEHEKIFIQFKFEGKEGVYRDIMYADPNSDSFIKITRFRNNIISGEFHITYLIEQTSSVLRYTEGRFDINLNYK